MGNLFDGTKKPKNLLQYHLMRGVPDYGAMNQYNVFEKGYNFLKVVSIPPFLQQLAKNDSDYADIIAQYVHILEWDFKGLSGLENITSDTFNITNGITDINMISKVNMQSAAQISMEYYERSGSPIAKFNELFLTGIKDPKTQVKTYHGLIQNQGFESGYEQEVFTFLFGATDNTFTKLEKAFLFLSAQPNSADMQQYAGTREDISMATTTVEINCYPVTGPVINKKAQDVLSWLISTDNPNRIHLTYDDMTYTGTDKIDPKAEV